MLDERNFGIAISAKLFNVAYASAIKPPEPEPPRITLFESILKDSPEYVGSYYHLGKLLERNGETQAAIEWYEKGMLQAKAANDQHAYNELQAAYEDLAY